MKNVYFSLCFIVGDSFYNVRSGEAFFSVGGREEKANGKEGVGGEGIKVIMVDVVLNKWNRV